MFTHYLTSLKLIPSLKEDFADFLKGNKEDLPSIHAIPSLIFLFSVSHSSPNYKKLRVNSVISRTFAPEILIKPSQPIYDHPDYNNSSTLL